MTTSFSGRHFTYAPAVVELTDREIEARFGDVLGMAMTSFVADPTYLVDMATQAAQISSRRESPKTLHVPKRKPRRKT
jgi:hypothetical protein